MSTTLPHGIIQINEGNIAWYGDITANWQLIDSKIGIYDAAIATIPAPANNGTLTINYGGTTIAMFGADDSGNATADIPAPGDGTLTIKVNGATAGTFTANASVDKTININTTDDTKIPLSGSNAISGSLIPSTTNTIDIGSSSKKIKSVFANYLNSIDLSTLFTIMNVGPVTDLNDSSLRVAGKLIVCSYGRATSNNPTPQASGTCFTLANTDSSNYGIQVALSNKGIYTRRIEDGNYLTWVTIVSL